MLFFLSAFIPVKVLAVDGLLNGKQVTGETDNYLLWLQTYDANNAPFYTDRLFVDKSGNVGIGTINPLFKLDVSGTGSFTQPVIVGTPTASTHAATKNYVDSVISGGSGSTVGYWTMNGTNIYNSNSGNVGIGAGNPGAKLQISGSGDSPNGLLYIDSTSTNARGTLARVGYYSYWNMDSGGNTYWNWGSRYDGGANQWVRAYTSADKYLPYTKYGTDGRISFGSSVSNLSTDTNPTMSDKVVFDMNPGNVGVTVRTAAAGWPVNSGIAQTYGLLRLQPSNSNVVLDFGSQAPGAWIQSTYSTDLSVNYPLLLNPNGGNVGIGTTATAYKLDVSGTGSFTQPVVVGTPTASTHAATKNYVDSLVGGGVPSGTNGQTIRNNGGSWIATSNLYNDGTNIGIGTTAPSQKLHLYSSSPYLFMQSSANADNGLLFGRNAGTADAALKYNFISNGDLGLYTGGITSAFARIYINSTGNVGIGTTAPAYKLDVNGTGNFTQPVIVGTPTASTHAATKNYVDSLVGGGIPTGTSGQTIRNNGGSWAADSNLYNNGTNVGIGTSSPTAKLEISGDMKLGGNYVDMARLTDSMVLFDSQPYIEGGYWPFSGSPSTYANINDPSQPFGKVAEATNPNSLLSDFIPVNAGDTLYGEIWAMRDASATGNPGTLYYGIERYDKDKKPLSSNSGCVYSFSSAQTVPLDGVWHKYSGYSILPTSHVSYNGSDGGPVRYVRIRLLINYNSGTIPTYYGGVILRKVELNNDSGRVAFNGNVGIGTDSPVYSLDVQGTGNFTQPVIVGTPTASSHAATKNYVDSVISGGSGSTVGYWTMNGTNIYNSNAGNIGIGTSNPTSKLYVSGNVTADNYYGTSFYGRKFGSKSITYFNVGTYYYLFSVNPPSNGQAASGDFEIYGSGSYHAVRGTITAKNAGGVTSAALHIYSSDTNNYTIVGYRHPDNYTIDFYFTPISTVSFTDYYNASNLMGYSFIDSSAPASPASITYSWNSGNVGIGTTAAAYNLDVNGTGNFTQPVIVGTPTASSHAATKNYVDSVISGGSGSTVGYWTMNGTNIYNSNAGNIGIGTSNPTTAKLMIVGGTYGAAISDRNYTISTGALPGLNILASTNYGGDGGTILLGGSAGPTAYIRSFATNNNAGELIIGNRRTSNNDTMSAGIVLNTAGKVGIGTTNPDSTLEAYYVPATNATIDDVLKVTSKYDAVSGASAVVGSGPAILFSGGIGDNQERARARIVAVYEGGNRSGLSFHTQDTADIITEKVRISRDGNVGIGTTVPAYKLDVQGTGNFTQPVIVGTPTASTHAATKNYVDSLVGGGIPTGTTGQTIRNNGGSWVVDSNLYNNGTNVGIGTNNPTKKLDVNGSIGFAGQTSYQGYAVVPAPGESNKQVIDWIDGVSVLDRNYQYRVQLYIRGDSSTPAGATYIIRDSSGYISDSPAWEVRAVSMAGNNSNNVALDVNASQQIEVYHFHTSGTYTVGYIVTAYQTNNNNSSFSIFGSDYGWSRLVNSLSYTDGNVGIGTVSPSYGLDVSGTARFTQPVIVGTPTASNHAATKNYVDSVISGGSGSTVGYWTMNGTNIYNSNAGNIGIGATAPSQRLVVSGPNTAPLLNAASVSDASLLVTNNDPAYGTFLASLGSGIGVLQQRRQSTATYYDFLLNPYGGNIGIGTTAPLEKLHVNGGLAIGVSSENLTTLRYGVPSNGSFQIHNTQGSTEQRLSILDADGTYGSSLVYETQTSPLTVNSIDSAAIKFIVRDSGNVGLGTSNPVFKLEVSGTGSFSQPVVVATPTASTHATTKGYVDSAISSLSGSPSFTGDLNMNGNDILNVNKLTVNTIDPLYSIDGGFYSTYASSISGGVKEEYVGKIKVSKKVGSSYEAVISFDKEKKGTDLWVWRQVVDFSADNVDMTLTPIGSFANAYYYISGNSIIIRSDAPTELSYRLTGKRFDWRKWPTASKGNAGAMFVR